MDGRYDEYPEPAGQRPGYPARPGAQRQGQAQRGQYAGPGQGYPGQGYPGQGHPGQGYPGQGYPGQGYPGQGQSARPGTAPQGIPPRGTSPQPRHTGPQQPQNTGPQQPWSTGPQQPAGDPRGRYPSSDRTRGFDAGPGPQNEPFLPGWDDDDDDDRGRGGKRGKRADFFNEDFDEPPRRRRRRFRWMAPLVALIVIAGVLGVPGYFGYKFYMGKYHPADYSGSGYGSVLVQVPSGANATSLGPELQRLGVVASSRAFVLAAEHATTASTLEVGYFNLHMHMQASLAWAILTNPKNMVQTLVRFPEGLRKTNILAVLSQQTKIPLSDYQAAIKNTAALGLPSYAKGNPEGYLFPATYQVKPHETALQVLQAMVAKYNQEAAALHLTATKAPMNLTTAQVMIVASLVQAEGGRVSDYPKIARVVYNRLKLNMKLQFDSTVLYGLNKFGTRATFAQLAVNTPYNSYMHTGLPPTPIDSPGVAAIQAALTPTQGTVASKWLYFLSFKNGTTEFSATPIKS